MFWRSEDEGWNFDLKEMGFNGVRPIYLVQDRDQLCTLVNATMNLFPYTTLTVILWSSLRGKDLKFIYSPEYSLPSKGKVHDFS